MSFCVTRYEVILVARPLIKEDDCSEEKQGRAPLAPRYHERKVGKALIGTLATFFPSSLDIQAPFYKQNLKLCAHSHTQ